MSDLSVNVCAFLGCGRPRRGNQEYCPAHCQQLVRGKELSPITRQSQMGKQCVFPDCERGVKAKGYCGPHYQQHLAGIEMKPLRHNNEGRECLVPGCERVAVTKGYCHTHYMFQRRLNPTALEKDRSSARRRYAADPSGQKNRYLLCYFGISLREWDEMFASQGGVCAICQKPETAVIKGKVADLAVDHKHDHDCVHTGVQKACPECIRGLLCRDCNTMLGKVNDDIAVLRRAADYLEKLQDT